jgi:nitrite reductase/ring-hydroxylating ferredoxin subunit
VKVPFTWKVTGWFMIGWSAEFPVGEVRPLGYFGEDLVGYRDESGELHLLQAHCRHLGAHIGHGGKVIGDCHGRRQRRVPGRVAARRRGRLPYRLRQCGHRVHPVAARDRDHNR